MSGIFTHLRVLGAHLAIWALTINGGIAIVLHFWTIIFNQSKTPVAQELGVVKAAIVTWRCTHVFIALLPFRALTCLIDHPAAFVIETSDAFIFPAVVTFQG